MADYQLTATDAIVLRTADQAFIPCDLANRDWVEYQDWLAAGGQPDPHVPPEPAPPPLLYDHENRIRALEGQPPLSMEEFSKKG
jgi:hypothetical protein